MEPLQTLVPSCRSMSPLLRGSLSGNGSNANLVISISSSGQENTPPIHPNVQVHRSSPTSVAKKTLKQQTAPRNGENPCLIGLKAEAIPPTDASVKVVVRIRPDNGHEKVGAHIVRRISSDTLSVGNHQYSFDSIFDSGSSQEDVFSVVGVPLVKNSLAGFNNSIISYGQSGTGKSYTMWGPPSAMVDGLCINDSQGIVPRMFQMLFSEINKKVAKSEDVQTNYQCRCSFLEIYNEQINDLLDPTQRNLPVRDDTRNAFQVENMCEEYVNNFRDVTQLLVKGLSNRKVGATSVNSKSSRSHIIFTCVIESWCKGLSSNLISSSKASRISFVDLAGIDNCKPEGFSRQSIQEELHIKQSLSKLGRLVKFLSDYTPLENDEKAPHVDSCLTDVLQDTLGGNAKVTFVCTIFPDERYKSSTLSTLRFGGRAKQMKNIAIINEISEDDVNGLSDQIRQLKEELIRAKSCESSSSGDIDGYFNRRNTRESLNLLRRSLNRSLLLPSIDKEPQEYLDVGEEDVRNLCVQLNLHSSTEEHAKNVSSTEEHAKNVSTLLSDDIADEESNSSLNQHKTINDLEPDCCSSKLKEGCSEVSKHENSCTLKAMLMERNQIQDISENFSLCVQSPQLEEPVFCASPRVDNRLKKSRSYSPSLAFKNKSSCSPKFGSEIETVNMGHPICSSLQSNKVSPIESLAASLHRGLQIIDYHQRSSNLNKSPVALSFEHLTSISCQSGMEKVDAPLLCSACKSQVTDNGNCNMDMQIIQVDGHRAVKESINEAAEVPLKTSGDPKQINTELEALCVEQAVKIKELESQIDLLNKLGEQSSSLVHNPSAAKEYTNEEKASFADGGNGKNENIADHGISLCSSEREEIQCLRKKLKSSICSTNVSLLELVRNGSTPVKGEEFESEKQRWMESESRWICLTEELRMDLESNRRLAEKKELELSHEKHCVAELDDALHRSIQGHARIIEHYAELQEKYDELLGKHRKVMDGIAEVKKAAAKAGTKGKGSAFAAALAAELATSRIEREKERTRLKDQNRILKLQLRDTAEAVHAAGELLVRLKEAEEAVSVTNGKYNQVQKEKESLKRQMEKLKKKHIVEIATMKNYLAESRLPKSALEPLYQHASESVDENKAILHDDDMSWRSAFRPSYH